MGTYVEHQGGEDIGHTLPGPIACTDLFNVDKCFRRGGGRERGGGFVLRQKSSHGTKKKMTSSKIRWQRKNRGYKNREHGLRDRISGGQLCATKEEGGDPVNGSKPGYLDQGLHRQGQGGVYWGTVLKIKRLKLKPRKPRRETFLKRRDICGNLAEEGSLKEGTNLALLADELFFTHFRQKIDRKGDREIGGGGGSGLSKKKLKDRHRGKGPERGT